MLFMNNSEHLCALFNLHTLLQFSFEELFEFSEIYMFLIK